jgi:hypothetical protein
LDENYCQKWVNFGRSSTGYPTGKEGGEFLFNGAVAGDPVDVCSFVEKLYEVLRNGGFEPKLEVYDEDGKCIAEFDA